MPLVSPRFGGNGRCREWTEKRRIVLLHTTGATATGSNHSFLGRRLRSFPVTCNETTGTVEFIELCYRHSNEPPCA
jgi:hypothetical protein